MWSYHYLQCNFDNRYDILPKVPLSLSDVYILTSPPIPPLLAACDTDAIHLVIVGKPSLFWLVPHFGIILQLFSVILTRISLYYFIMMSVTLDWFAFNIVFWYWIFALNLNTIASCQIASKLLLEALPTLCSFFCYFYISPFKRNEKGRQRYSWHVAVTVCLEWLHK